MTLHIQLHKCFCSMKNIWLVSNLTWPSEIIQGQNRHIAMKTDRQINKQTDRKTEYRVWQAGYGGFPDDHHLCQHRGAASPSLLKGHREAQGFFNDGPPPIVTTYTSALNSLQADLRQAVYDPKNRNQPWTFSKSSVDWKKTRFHMAHKWEAFDVFLHRVNVVVLQVC